MINSNMSYSTKTITLIIIMILSSFPALAGTKVPLTEEQIHQILKDPKRFSNDEQKDLNRKPNKLLIFSNVAKGDAVLDIFAGGGWYSEIFSKAVGSTGQVFAQNDELTWRFGGQEMSARTAHQRLKNITRLDEVAIKDIALANNSIDIAFMAINYHDLYFTHRYRNGQYEQMRPKTLDYKLALTNVKRILKEDGVLIISDHIAKAGSGYQAANDLHRIDPNIVQFELEQAGFELLEEAFYLRNPNDNLEMSVFDPKIRWNTSRFIYKFGKKTVD